MLIQKNSVVVNKNVIEGSFRKVFTHIGNTDYVKAFPFSITGGYRLSFFMPFSILNKSYLGKSLHQKSLQ
jgi:hypothetical protein